MGRFIITDLTRFDNPDKVCIAAIDQTTGECVRPLPYLSSDIVKNLNIHPGAMLDRTIVLKSDAQNPHIEDASYEDLKYTGSASAGDFKSILDRTLSRSIAAGFGVRFAENQKHIPAGQHADCSIVTIKVLPTDITIHEDQYKPGRIKASFTDSERHSYRYLSITDRGFFDYAKKHQNDGSLALLQTFLRSQEEVYLRVGVSRQFKIGYRDGYWLQVNGVYTFPDFFREIRTY